MKFPRLALTLLCLLICNLATQAGVHSEKQSVHSYTPHNGFVPDAITATAIAEAILVPIYGRENIERQKPLKAVLTDEVWTVTGTLPKGFMGGVALIKICKRNAHILRVSHGK